MVKTQRLCFGCRCRTMDEARVRSRRTTRPGWDLICRRHTRKPDIRFPGARRVDGREEHPRHGDSAIRDLQQFYCTWHVRCSVRGRVRRSSVTLRSFCATTRLRPPIAIFAAARTTSCTTLAITRRHAHLWCPQMTKATEARCLSTPCAGRDEGPTSEDSDPADRTWACGTAVPANCCVICSRPDSDSPPGQRRTASDAPDD